VVRKAKEVSRFITGSGCNEYPDFAKS